MRYSNEQIQILLNSATFFDPRFKNTFVTKEKEAIKVLMQKVDLSHLSQQMKSTQTEQEEQTGGKKQKKYLGSLLL